MKLNKANLDTIFNGKLVTLGQIHDLLEIKQHINVYLKNTNKKYNTDFLDDEVIPTEIKNIIVLNTLGKLNLLNEQAYYLRLMSNKEQADKVLEKAQKFAEKANLFDKIVQMAKIVPSFMIFDDENKIKDLAVAQGVPNLKYMDSNGVQEWYKDQLDYLISLYKEV